MEIDHNQTVTKIKELEAEILRLKAALEIPRPDAPLWFNRIKEREGVLPVDAAEFNDSNRVSMSFTGTDYCHSRPNSPVHIMEYVLLPPKDGESYYSLCGLVHFSPKAESHIGLCHGGSMTAVMDDALGWLGFCFEGKVKPWCGFTVQVDTSLRKPVKVGSLLKVLAWVERREGDRKVYVCARLTDVADDGEEVVHCEGRGLFLLSKKTE